MTAASVRPGLLSLGAAHVRRDALMAFSYKVPFVMGLFVSFQGLVMYYFIAQLIDESQFPDSPELAQGYLAFVVVGNAISAIISVGLADPPGRLQQAQGNGTIEAIATTPTPMWLTTMLGSLYQLLYATLGSMVTVGLSILLLGVRVDASASGFVIAGAGLVLTFILFASLGLCIAAFAIVYKRISPVLALTNAALGFMSGVFFPIELLPGPLPHLARALPFSWAVDVVRLSLLAGETPVRELAVLTGAAAVSLPVAILVFHLALRRTRSAGTLSHY